MPPVSSRKDFFDVPAVDDAKLKIAFSLKFAIIELHKVEVIAEYRPGDFLYMLDRITNVKVPSSISYEWQHGLQGM